MNPALAAKDVTVEALVQQATEYRKEGYRLAQISATRLAEEVELTYSFDRETKLEHIRLHLPAAAARVPSITPVYWCAFLYENEIHDLFNVQVDGLTVDFHGGFYKTAVQFPFGATKPPVLRPPAATTQRTGQVTPPAVPGVPAATPTSVHPN